MPGWDELIREVETSTSKMALDEVRNKYIRRLSQLTGRNTVVYFSGWLKDPRLTNVDINDGDMVGFMNALREMDCSKGLDLILHTPGGDPCAAESIVKYLRSKFDKNIRVIIPHLAMSAGTMIACSAHSIVMGKQSSLGPIDPQIRGVPAYNILNEFDEAKKDLVNHPENRAYWQVLLSKYTVAYTKEALDAILLSTELVSTWLSTCMFTQSESDQLKIQNIVRALNEHYNSKIHNRHFNITFCKQLGLRVEELEANNQLQDAVLSIYHAFSITVSHSNATKIIENDAGKRYICNMQK